MKTFGEFLTESVNGGTNLNESSMTRFISKFQKHDAVIMTAYRGGLTKAENKARNAELFSALFAKGYSITKVKGSYIENYQEDNQKEVSEQSFVVVNHNDDKDFKKVVEKLGQKYDQDSILIINGGEKPTAYLLGTNDADFPGKGKKVEFNNVKFNRYADVEFFTRLGGNKFHFTESYDRKQHELENGYPNGSLGRMACKRQGKEILESIGIDV